MTSYAPPRNEHENGILRRSTLPAPAEIASQWTEAAALTGRIAEALGHVGVLTAIVISFGMTALIVVLALRAYLESGTDKVDFDETGASEAGSDGAGGRP